MEIAEELRVYLGTEKRKKLELWSRIRIKVSLKHVHRGSGEEEAT